jgi:lysophospholipase L1-like esterase
MPRLLCFGDSNTWGYTPQNGERFPYNVRWPGVLAKLLGVSWTVVEEGLNGRTTAFDYKDRPGKNGLAYLGPCLDSHFPLDAIIVGLGTNDTKTEFGLSPQEIAAGMERVVALALKGGLERRSKMRVIISGAPRVREERMSYPEMKGAEAKTAALAPLYRALAEKHGAVFVDLSVVEASPFDGYHLEPEGHAAVAALYRDALRGI